MKKIILYGLSILILNGCASMDDTMYGQVSARQKELIKAYDYPYDEVYNAIVSVLERRLKFHVNKTYTTKDTIYSSYASSPFTFVYKGAYVYLFKLRAIDNEHTEISLKAQGSTIVVSDNDMLNRYVPEELKYLSSK